MRKRIGHTIMELVGAFLFIAMGTILNFEIKLVLLSCKAMNPFTLT